MLLYTRNGIFYARVYKGDRSYIHRTLKTSKVGEARKLAVKFLYEIEFKKAEQLPLQQRSFNDVIDEYTSLREREYERSKKDKVNTSTQQQTSIFMLRQIRRVVKFWREYAGNRQITQIGDAELSGYVDWRRDYYADMTDDELPQNAKRHPTDKTLQWEIMLGKSIDRKSVV